MNPVGSTPSPVSVSDPGDKEYRIVAPGPIWRSRKVLVAKFPQLQPNFKDPTAKWRLGMDNTEKKSTTSKDKVPMLLERRPGEPSQRGLPEGGSLSSAMGPPPARQQASTAPRPAAVTAGASAPPAGISAGGGGNYFVLVRQGKQVTAFPADLVYQFKPIVNRAGAGSLEEAEAIMSRQWDPSPGEVTEATGRLAPRSAREAAAKQKLDDLESGPIVKARNDLDSDMLNLFGSEDEEDLDDADDDGPKRGRRGGGRRVAPGAGKSKGRGGKGGGGGEDADEVEEEDEDDNYEGEGDDLRPEKPEPAEDWEHEQEFDDDDEAVEGADDDGQRTVDDPGERKELGIDLDEDEEAQEEEDIKRLKEEEALEEDAAAGGWAEGEGAGGKAVDVEEDLDLDAMDAMAQDTLSKAGAGRAPATRAATPPPGSKAASGAMGGVRAATPPPTKSANGKRKASEGGVSEEKKQASRGAGGVTKRARSATPPPPSSQGSAGVSPPRPSQAPAGKPPRSPLPPQKQVEPSAVPPKGVKGGALGSKQRVTTEDIIHLLRANKGSLPLQDVKAHFKDRVNKASMVEFKETLKMVIKDKVEKDSVGLSTVTLKDEYMM